MQALSIAPSLVSGLIHGQRCKQNDTMYFGYVSKWFICKSVGRSGEDESQEDVLMDEAPSNMSQASTLQANREGRL